MDQRTLDVAVPVIYGALVGASAMWFSSALVPIAAGGGVLVSLYWAAFRQKLAPQNPPRPAPGTTEPQDRPVPRADDPPYGSA
ncbi:hypothetical protein V5D56_02415 [Cellulosimicrobium sp. PMB13]|uniref:hypothetical protein n=1 Tax=Cellulosimicrobium sp. PMB13 TaxID=3120158 RepID=UPI003F4BC807